MRVAHDGEGTGAYLIQQSIGSIHRDAQYALLASKGTWRCHGWLAVVACAGLREDGVDLRPIGAGGLIESCAEQPVALGVAEEQGDGLAAYVEICGIVFADVDGYPATRGGGLGVLVERAYRRWRDQGEVCGCEGWKEEEP